MSVPFYACKIPENMIIFIKYVLQPMTVGLIYEKDVQIDNEKIKSRRI